MQREDANSGFDFQSQLRFIKAIGSTDAQKHYAVRLSIVATDNNINTGPGTSSATLPHSFLVVSENELLVLMMLDQRKYHEILQKVVDDLDSARQKLDSQLSDYRKAPEEPTKLLVRSDTARKALREGSIRAKAIAGKYEGLLKEMEFNRMKKERVEKVKTRVADPLASMTSANGLFSGTEEQAGKLYKELSPDADKKEKADAVQRGNDPALLKALEANKATHIKNCEKTLDGMGQLVRDLQRILDAMRDITTEDEATEELVRIEALQRELTQRVVRFDLEFRKKLQELLQGD
jgi:hypothetical protein